MPGQGRDARPGEGDEVSGAPFGTALRQVRARRQISLSALSQLVHYSKGYLSRVETGHRLPTAELARRCDEALSADGALADLVPATAPTRRAAGPRPAQLPYAVAGFTGRAAALGELATVISGPPAAPVVVITGAPGIGKTALAVHVAHRVAARFPDGQLYVNLRGFDPSEPPVTPGAAVRRFLDALQAPAARIPADPDGQAALYRSLLAGRRLLVVADNARDAAQVRPLLPGTPGCLVLVTSRSQLTSLTTTDGAWPLRLDVLTPAEARQLLAARIGASRVAAEPDAVTEIIAACGRLPLALAIVAARAAAHPGFRLRGLAAELRDGELDALAGDDLLSDVQVVFSWSYRVLAPGAARLFRLMGLQPGADIAAPAAASLAGLPWHEIRPWLAELTAAHMIAEHVPGRYAFHDLLRAYAVRQASISESSDQRHAAIGRLVAHYTHTASTADRLLDRSRDPIALAPLGPGVTPEEFPGYRQALAWFIREHATLLAVVDAAAAAGFDTVAWQLGWALWPFLSRGGHWQDQVAVGRTALAAAQRLADPQAQARAHRLLGTAYVELRCWDDASTQLRQALELCGQAGDPVGQGRAQHGLAIACGRQGQYPQALDHARQALELYRAAGHRRGQARALNSAGWSHAQLGDYQQALIACEQALSLHAELGDQHGLANTWDSLGCARHRLGQYDQATACYQRAIGIYRDLGDSYYEADSLIHLGDTSQASGDPGAAREAWQLALPTLDELTHPDAAQVRAKLAALTAGSPPVTVAAAASPQSSGRLPTAGKPEG